MAFARSSVAAERTTVPDTSNNSTSTSRMQTSSSTMRTLGAEEISTPIDKARFAPLVTIFVNLSRALTYGEKTERISTRKLSDNKTLPKDS